jgi:DtxR family Mn-dependent transcriptional regulator
VCRSRKCRRRRPISMNESLAVREPPVPGRSGVASPDLWTQSSRTERRGVFVDSTEMYLRAIFELEEEADGTEPNRAALQCRLGISRSAVSQHVSRLIQDGLATLSPHKRVRLTEEGRAVAAAVMRKHRLAERLLVDVIGLEWELAHDEASRWQHVLGEVVERKLLGILAEPWRSPFGNPIHALDQLDPDYASEDGGAASSLRRADDVASDGGGRARVARIQEIVQCDRHLLARLRAFGVVPGAIVEIARREGAKDVTAATTSGRLTLDARAAHSILVASNC